MGRKSRDDKPTENGEKPALTPDDAKAVMEQAVSEALKQNPDAKLPELMRDLFNAVIDQAKAKADAQAAPAEPAAPEAPSHPVQAANVVDLDAERQKREAAKATEDAIQTSVRGAVTEYMTENFPKETQEVLVDPTFLKDHGPGLFAALLSGFAQAIVPEEIKVDVPTDDGDKKMTLKVDFAGLFKNLGKKVEAAPAASNEPPKEPDQG